MVYGVSELTDVGTGSPFGSLYKSTPFGFEEEFVSG